MTKMGPRHGMADWGWVDEDELRRVVVLSPHPDDAVLSCGQFLSGNPGVTVVTVFCGFPATYPDPPNAWAQLSGFAVGDDIVAIRRDEDRRALTRLAARWIHLDGFAEADLQPAEPVATATGVADTLSRVLVEAEPTMVVLPMGLANPEHVTVHDAALLVRDGWSADSAPPSWIAYQDVAYHQIPGLLAWRVSKLFHSGLWPSPVAMPVDVDPTAKRAALAEYQTQMRALEADWGIQRRLDAPTPEQFWRLAPPPPGWEGLAAR